MWSACSSSGLSAWIDLLLEHGADPRIQGSHVYPLDHACRELEKVVSEPKLSPYVDSGPSSHDYVPKALAERKERHENIRSVAEPEWNKIIQSLRDHGAVNSAEYLRGRDRRSQREINTTFEVAGLEDIFNV